MGQILFFLVDKAICNIRRALDSLFVLLKLNVGESGVLETVENDKEGLFVKMTQLIQIESFVIRREDSAAFLSVSQHIEIFLPEMKF